MCKNIILRKCAEDDIQIHPHCNSIVCSENIIEINPAKSCQFHCQYCCVYTQERTNKFLPLTIYEDYPDLLENYIVEHKDKLDKLVFFYSFESDCFEDGLISSGLTLKILNLLNKHKAKYFLLTKGALPNKNIGNLLIKARKFAQIIVNDTMPNDIFRKKLEPFTATNDERFNLVKFCIDNKIPVTVSFSPILPFYTLDYLKEKISKYNKLGVVHFRLDMLELSIDSLNKITDILPEYKEKIEKIYFSNDAIVNDWVSPSGQVIRRYKPSEDILINIYYTLKDYIKSINPSATVSICNNVIVNVKRLKEFNKEAYIHGYNCMGFKYRRED